MYLLSYIRLNTIQNAVSHSFSFYVEKLNKFIITDNYLSHVRLVNSLSMNLS